MRPDTASSAAATSALDIVLPVLSVSVRSVLLAKGQTPHLAECQWDLASVKSTWKRKGDNKVQAEEEEIGETHGKEQGEDQRENQRSSRTHG